MRLHFIAGGLVVGLLLVTTSSVQSVTWADEDTVVIEGNL
jgi:hypothetical protein